MAAYEKRKYRQRMQASGLVSFQAMVKETDLFISAERDLTEEALFQIKEARRLLEQHIRKHPEFLSSLVPLDPHDDAPPLIRTMYNAGKAAGVGPMASVAGAIAEYVGRGLLKESREVIVENGGDLFLVSMQARIVSLDAGSSPFTGQIGIKIQGERTPLGVCTSSGTVGHSLSFGKSDAVCVLAASTALADAAATAAGNRIQTADDIRKTLDFIASIPGIQGGLIVVQEKMGAWGKVEIVKL
jgi:ApbE superfamily uncharacterized protein (UPF0280 family)